MPLAIPSILELKNIRALIGEAYPETGFANLRVLEIGAGDGRLTRPLAPEAALWVGTDAQARTVQLAAQDQRASVIPPLRWAVSDSRAQCFAPESFEVVFFAWVLCCLPISQMAQALAEARRVLRPSGQLLDLHPLDDPTALEVWQAAFTGEAAPERLEAIDRIPLGWLEHGTRLEDFTAATDALAAALENGFALRRSTAFEYRYFFRSIEELTHHLRDNHENAAVSPALLQQAEQALHQAGPGAKLVTIQSVAASALEKL